MNSQRRFEFPRIEGAGEILSTEFLEFLANLDESFQPRIAAVRSARDRRIQLALKGKTPPTPLLQNEANTTTWQVPSLPEQLQAPGIEISGPASIPSMMIQALNPGPDGERAVGYLDDDEDSGGHSLADTVQAARNRRDALARTLIADDPT